MYKELPNIERHPKVIKGSNSPFQSSTAKRAEISSI